MTMNEQIRQTTLTLVAIILTLSALGQQRPSSSTPTQDRFVGAWKLNLDKSSMPPASKTISIEHQGNAYRIRCHVRYDNGTELDSWSLTDMKGEMSKVGQSDGKPMNEEWRVTRESPDSFVIDSRPFRTVVRYTVSSDGQTLTARKVSSAMAGGKIENGVLKSPVEILVFDKAQ